MSNLDWEEGVQTSSYITAPLFGGMFACTVYIIGRRAYYYWMWMMHQKWKNVMYQ